MPDQTYFRMETIETYEGLLRPTRHGLQCALCGRFGFHMHHKGLVEREVRAPKDHREHPERQPCGDQVPPGRLRLPERGESEAHKGEDKQD